MQFYKGCLKNSVRFTTGLFYFGGHGYENNGKTYLMPTDAPKFSEITDGDRTCIEGQRSVEDVQHRCDPKLMVILLDTCRTRLANLSF